jgi:hypothetical protein
LEKDYNSLLKEIAIPRISGKTGEKEVREKIFNRMKELGFDVVVEDFYFSKFPAEILQRGILIFFWTLSILIILFFRNSILVKVLFYILIFLSLPFLTRWSEKIEIIYDLCKKSRSANILAFPKGNTEKKVLFLAHYDSKSQFLPLPLRIFFFFLFLLSTLIIPSSDGFWKSVLLIQTISLVFLLLNFTSNSSKGAIDNASGVFSLLILAEKIKNEKVAFLFTGAEEMGLCGAIEFLKNHQKELPEDVVIINIDGIGNGKSLIITTKFGVPPKRTSKDVYKTLKGIAEKRGLKTKEGWLPFGAALDHIPFAVKGYESLTLHLSSSKDSFFVHTRWDIPEKVNIERVQEVSDILYQFLKEV